MKRKYFEIYVRIMEGDEAFIVSDGYISIEDEKFEGYITDDYISGTFKEQKLLVKISMYDYTDHVINYDEFESKVDFFEIPETYLLKECKENDESEFKIEITFKEEVKEITKFEKIDTTIKNIKAFYHIK